MPQYNPYHFIPVEKRNDAQSDQDLRVTDFDKRQLGTTTHGWYPPRTHSGVLECSLTTETPAVLGGEQDRPAGDVATVRPYMIEGRPAVPGSSLRGSITSLIDAASNSALRVLTKNTYSYRKAMDPKQTLSALGMIVSDKTGFRLRPVALPTLSEKRRDSWAVPMHWRRAFPKPRFKVLIGDYDTIRQPGFRLTARDESDVVPWGLRQLSYNPDGGIDDHPSLRFPSRDESRRFLIGQVPEDGIPAVNGWIRVLGCWGERAGDAMPSTKKHELWLPVPPPETKTLPIDTQAIDRFHALADERTEENPSLPYQPLETRRNVNPAEYGQKFRIKHGDLVYFDLRPDGVVCEIALAAIWRQQVVDKSGKGAGAWEFFQHVDPDLVPFHKDRKKITIGERINGFVEETPGEGTHQDGGHALASRIRFSDAVLAPGVTKEQALEERDVILRILSSPKPPSPALYFRKKAGASDWIGKAQLKPEDHAPQGRKVYLHHRVAPGNQPWKTRDEQENRDQKTRVRPIRAGQTFAFRISFDNLTDQELGLLLYALAPDEAFHHKIGMGKPLGLGSVKIQVRRQGLIDRKERYTLAGLRADRYQRLIESGDANFWRLRDAAISSGLVSKRIHEAICTLGDLEHSPVSGNIHTPTLAGQRDPEQKTYEWFVLNDRKIHNHLKPLSEAGGVLPALD